ncbi:uncharacterized protein MCYG_04131 [Microsporum canis CBS 113480]|uniref:Uncharacterized protein n=1 Tax=Arthroderma otae (strain ATCC MYA-4605 / CBS 113480) TaxID=554155 RepID=C5FN76_ARTOC|nr:uncharacterized protein MCYG_04131 [Microsporum canis CBS 113480]EEQ31312.1 predicted protein [Microsporum canis CBS 113480]
MLRDAVMEGLAHATYVKNKYTHPHDLAIKHLILWHGYLPRPSRQRRQTNLAAHEVWPYGNRRYESTRQADMGYEKGEEGTSSHVNYLWSKLPNQKRKNLKLNVSFSCLLPLIRLTDIKIWQPLWSSNKGGPYILCPLLSPMAKIYMSARKKPLV